MEDQNEVADRLLWFFVGAAVGASVALLYAPASGSETRRYLKAKAEEGSQAIADSGRDVFEKSRSLYEKGRQMADEAADLFERGRKLVES